MSGFVMMAFVRLLRDYSFRKVRITKSQRKKKQCVTNFLKYHKLLVRKF